MQDGHLCSPPLLSPWPRNGPSTFFIVESPLLALLLKNASESQRAFVIKLSDFKQTNCIQIISLPFAELKNGLLDFIL